ncbi:hypothetical protein B0H67DRAFT_551135 [Lasiosphaeris hirsuta]|uniref:Uncharacterized protein n=1 Tax=Lasiosphaeris hirsuta TaxID=260670 RepID=A0AA40B108_9PEZI|nr:hypothetical protein B0H67DRAFT_551135 [Lasiosphaeris hirsuta]
MSSQRATIPLSLRIQALHIEAQGKVHSLPPLRPPLRRRNAGALGPCVFRSVRQRSRRRSRNDGDTIYNDMGTDKNDGNGNHRRSDATSAGQAPRPASTLPLATMLQDSPRPGTHYPGTLDLGMLPLPRLQDPDAHPGALPLPTLQVRFSPSPSPSRMFSPPPRVVIYPPPPPPLMLPQHSQLAIWDTDSRAYPISPGI